ncbi:hypothetical protein VTJ49DRAFT_3851 [Mycothermus thermophilus]|uniref:VOC domain-containing protein n=1 Tax=Humicola insolens TaxID=85995 RepID=A0ABR3VRE4_HUMIN
MTLNHISLPTTPSSHARMRDFYLASLKPLGYTPFKEQSGVFLGLQRNYQPSFWLHCCCGGQQDDDEQLMDPKLSVEENRKRLKGRKTHVAFEVSSRRLVDEWFKTAVDAGGIPNGEPGERPQYAKGYYAAFVLDPLGNNVEVLCFNPLCMQLLKAVPTVVTVLFGAVAGHYALGYAKAMGWA